MSVLLLRLAGPMQSWGVQSRFEIRDTAREPTKSGVIGLLCAALGKPRDERPGDGFPTLAELTALRMGIRVDREGLPMVDYQTAGGGHWRGEPYRVRRADGKSWSIGEAVLSSRHYLADADFLVGLEGDHGLLNRLDDALRRPHWPLCLGRKAFVPGAPVHLPDAPPLGPGVRDGVLDDVLAAYPRAAARRNDGRQGPRCRVVVDDPAGTSPDLRQDVPLDFAARAFGVRAVVTDFVTPPPEASCTSPA